MPGDSRPKKMLKIAYGGYSTKGVKEHNEDAFAALLPLENARLTKGAVACIADGVSCSENARLASQTSVTTFIQDYLSTPETWDIKTSAQRVLSSLNSWLYYQGQVAMTRHNGLVTTFSSVILKSTTAHILHCGDSRIYRYRDGELIQLTTDHTLERSGGNSTLTRGLGMDSDLKVDYQKRSIRINDILVMTTDGVHGSLSETDISSYLNVLTDGSTVELKEGPAASLENVSKTIITKATKNGSQDNLTCLLVKVLDVPVEDIDEAYRKLTSLVIPPVLEVGTTLDGYKVTKVLYSGPRSHIYLAQHPRFRQPFVLKVPSQQFAEDPEYLDGFVREQWAGRRIDNPGIMKIYDPVPDSKFLYHICEYVEGQTLRQWMNDNPKPDLNKVRELAEQLASNLRVFQRQGMLHRDLKPENIMLTTTGQSKLIDFGTVHVDGMDDISSPLIEETPVGTADYIAPEYLMGERGVHRSDIFSLGIIIYEMLTGELPYKTVSSRKHRVDSYDLWKYTNAREFRKDIPVWLDLTLKKACAPRPSQRYTALSEFLRDLQTPNKTLLSKYESAPLMEQNPLLFWKALSAILAFLLILQWAWPELTS